MGCHFFGHDQTIKSAYMAVSYFQIGVIRFDSAKVCYRNAVISKPELMRFCPA
jgi:hypothetical protein